MALIADTPTDRAEQLIAICERLGTLVDAETGAMRRSEDLPPIAEEKNRLANLYRQEVARVARDPSLLAGLSPRLKDRLAAATRTLQDAVEAHQRTLAAFRELTEGLVQALAEEVARQRAAQGAAYGPGGTARPVDAAAAGAIALDRSA